MPGVGVACACTPIAGNATVKNAPGACPTGNAWSGVGDGAHKQPIRKVISDSINAQRKMHQDHMEEGPREAWKFPERPGKSSAYLRVRNSQRGCGLNPALCLGSAFCWLCGQGRVTPPLWASVSTSMQWNSNSM